MQVPIIVKWNIKLMCSRYEKCLNLGLDTMIYDYIDKMIGTKTKQKNYYKRRRYLLWNVKYKM